MTTKKKTIISVILFIIIFGGILTVATFYDLQINQFLTQKSLAAHTYNTNDPFGAFFEVIGDCPVKLMLAFAFSLFFINAKRNMKGKKQTAVMILTAALTMVANFVFVMGVMDYIKPILIKDDSSYELAGGAFLTFVYLFIAAILSALALLAANNIGDESIKKLFKFAVATVVIAAIPTILVNLVLKDPIGRIRFRAMNMYPDDETYGFKAFARWYEINGQWIPKETMSALFGTTDALKSCPSGHTSAAGTIYALTLLNDCLDIKSKKVRAFNWIFPIAYTGTVALSRMVVGAHFLSDVLLGGTLTFVTMIITREVMLKGEHIKSLKK